MMRKLMFFTIGFSAAAAIGAYLLQGYGLLIMGFLCLVCGAILFAFSGTKARISRLILIGCTVAFAWMWILNNFYLADLRGVDGEEMSLSVQVNQFSVSTDHGITADGTVKINNKPYRIRIYSYDVTELDPGDCVKGTFRLRYTGGSSQEDIFYSGNGIYLVGYLREGEINSVTEPHWRHYPALWRKKILNLMERMLPNDTLAFGQALLLGEKSGLDYETNTNLAVSGIRHVVAVSGLHVSILCSLVFAIFGERRIVTPVVGILLLAVFAAMTGFTPSVVRSCVMYALIFGSIGLLREYDAPTALSFAVLVMLAVNPMSVTSVSLQLSVACVVGILMFSKSIREFLLSDRCFGKAGPRTTKGKIQRWIADSVSITVSTMITTMPLCAIYFGTVSILGIVTNLLTLWLINIIFTGLIIAVIAGFVWLPMGMVICWLISWLIRFVLLAARLIASVPFAAVYTKSPYVVAWIVFFYVLLAAFYFGKKKYPWLTVSCAAGTLCLAVCLSCLEPGLDNFRFSVLNVGQGQCIILQDERKTYMIDCGGDSDTVVADLAAQTLLSQGVTHLDGVILTHYDTDHVGALENLLSRVPADTLYLPSPGDASDYDTYADCVQYIESNGILQIPDTNLTVFSAAPAASDKESYLCILFQPDNCDILITGDRNISGERDLLDQAELPQVDVLVVGHHGAKDSTGLELLSAVRPKTAIISVGENNRYGHPSNEVLERLNIFGCEVLRTDIDGTILIRG